MTFLKIGAARRLLVIGACVAVTAMMPSPSHAAAKIQDDQHGSRNLGPINDE